MRAKRTEFLALVRSILAYDPETGTFTWTDAAPRNRGKVAGTLHKVHGYVRIMIGYKSYAAHQLAWLIMTGEWSTDEVDHENLIRSDNRWSNLRPATSQNNGQNRRVRSDSTTGLKGVKPHEGRFHARIVTQDRRRISLGLYDCPVAAHLAYVIAADIHHGQFARTV